MIGKTNAIINENSNLGDNYLCIEIDMLTANQIIATLPDNKSPKYFIETHTSASGVGYTRVYDPNYSTTKTRLYYQNGIRDDTTGVKVDGNVITWLNGGDTNLKCIVVW